MKDENGDELERIKQKKLEEMKQRTNPESAVDKPITITDATFKETIQNHHIIVVDCWAAWCGPCQMIGPIVEELAHDYRGRIIFGKLNVDENPDVAREFQIMSIPTLLVFKNGKLVDRIVGAMPKQMLEQRITRCIQ